MRSPIICSIALAALAASAAGCTRQPPAESAVVSAEEAPLAIRVISHNPAPVAVVMDAGARPIQLGVVRGGLARTFEVPWRAVAAADRVRLSAREVGHRTARTSGYVDV